MLGEATTLRQVSQEKLVGTVIPEPPGMAVHVNRLPPTAPKLAVWEV